MEKPPNIIRCESGNAEGAQGQFHIAQLRFWHLSFFQLFLRGKNKERKKEKPQTNQPCLSHITLAWSFLTFSGIYSSRHKYSIVQVAVYFKLKTKTRR